MADAGGGPSQVAAAEAVMLVGITGSSGLIGTALRARLEADGHEVRRFVRGKQGDPAALWDPEGGWLRPGALDGLDAIVHLAGESIGEGRWTAARKQAMRRSRVDSTRLLVAGLAAMQSPPALICASGVGYYGSRGDETLDESSAKGSGFLADLVADWEAEATRADDAGARTVLLRLGVVLAREGGALGPMARPFKFGVGGRLGSGRQWLSWVSLDDTVAAIVRALGPEMAGVYNVVAPNPVTNRELAQALGRALKRPSFMPMPAFALRLLLGEAADELLLASQRALPRRLQEAGFTFRHPDVSSALATAL